MRFLPRLSTLVLATRPAFLTISAVGCLIGFALSYRQSGAVHLWAWGLAIAIAVIGQASANVINDYWDSINGSDAMNENRIYPFTGGSRFIQDGRLTPHQVKWLGIATAALTLLAGLVLLASLNAWPLAWIGLLGLGIGWAYSASPFKLMARGVWGEAAIVAAWALIVVGSALLESHRVSVVSGVLGIAYGLLVANILFANQVPDISADRQAGKFTLAVVTPSGWLWAWYAAFAALAYAAMAALVVVNWVGPMALLGLLGVPFSIRATLLMKQAPGDRGAMTGCIQNTILGAHVFGLGLVAGLLLG